MLFRLLFIIVACGLAALGQNIGNIHEEEAAASIDTDPTLLLPQSEAHLAQDKTMHRRESPKEAGDAVVARAAEVAEIFEKTGALKIQPAKLAEPGCCG